MSRGGTDADPTIKIEEASCSSVLLVDPLVRCRISPLVAKSTSADRIVSVPESAVKVRTLGDQPMFTQRNDLPVSLSSTSTSGWPASLSGFLLGPRCGLIYRYLALEEEVYREPEI